MIIRIQALNYRSLKYIDQKLEPFHLLVGPNASGKTTFLDVITFLGELISSDLDSVIRKRTNNPQDLIWFKQGNEFELAIEVLFPKKLSSLLSNTEFDRIRYEIAINININNEGFGIKAERIWLKSSDNFTKPQRLLFPQIIENTPDTILFPKRQSKKIQKLVVSKIIGGNDSYYAETPKGYNPSFKQSPKRSALGNLPADEKSFPVSTWLKEFLTNGVQKFVLNSLLMREASPPGLGGRFNPDGSNIPWVINELKEKSESLFKNWIKHLQTALNDLEDIRTVERPDDKHRYLLVKYKGGLELPSWVLSDGTLRLLALTLPAYLTDFKGVYLIEEPENGIHPQAIETFFQSLSSVYDAQILVATHSPVLLGMINQKSVNSILCFAKNELGATDIVSGDNHPKLKEWSGNPDFYVLFASGILG